jgi:hypothetical protein
MLKADQRSWRELAMAEPIRIPGLRPDLFAAHLAYRRASGAANIDPYFAHPCDPEQSPTERLCAAASIRNTKSPALGRRGNTQRVSAGWQ